MTEFQRRVMQSLEADHKVNATVVAENLAHVIKGETITREYDGSGQLLKKKVAKKPHDMIAGLAVYDSLTGGALGITSKQVHQHRGARELYKEFRPLLPDGAVGDEVVYNRERKPEVIEMEEVEEVAAPCENSQS